jgi:hypothetical protein
LNRISALPQVTSTRCREDAGRSQGERTRLLQRRPEEPHRQGKNVDELRGPGDRFSDFKADGAAALQESPFFPLPAEQASFADFVGALVPEGGEVDYGTLIDSIANSV